MADYDLATITASLAQKLRDNVSRTFNSTSPLLRMLRVERGEGKNCAWAVELDGAIGENHADGADVASYGSDVPAFASLAWGLYRSNFKVTDLAASAASTTGNPAGLVNLAARGIVNSARKIASTLNGAGYAGAGTGTLIAGLNTALDDANTYGGINRSTGANALFRAKVVDPGVSTAITLALIRSDLGAIFDACGEKPNLALCDTTRWNNVAALFTELRRYQQDVFVDGAREIKMDASVDAIVIDGCMFVKDKDATAGRIYYLNTNYVYWQSLPPAADGPLAENMSVMQLADSAGDLGAQMAVRPLARTGAAAKVTASVQMQLVVEKPNACGVRKNVA